MTGDLYTKRFYGCLHAMTIHYDDKKIPVSFDADNYLGNQFGFPNRNLMCSALTNAPAPTVAIKTTSTTTRTTTRTTTTTTTPTTTTTKTTPTTTTTMTTTPLDTKCIHQQVIFIK
jgi:hypothetical protein